MTWKEVSEDHFVQSSTYIAARPYNQPEKLRQSFLPVRRSDSRVRQRTRVDMRSSFPDGRGPHIWQGKMGHCDKSLASTSTE